jgi:hypothetical protein
MADTEEKHLPLFVETIRTSIKSMYLSEMKNSTDVQSQIKRYLEGDRFIVETFRNDEGIDFRAWKESDPQKRMVIGYAGTECTPKANFLRKSEYEQKLQKKYPKELGGTNLIRTYWQYEEDGYVIIHVYADDSHEMASKGIAFCKLLSIEEASGHGMNDG